MSSASSEQSPSLSLIRRAQAADRSAWETLLRLYGPMIYLWGRREGLKPQDSADLTQQVFTSVWAGLKSSAWQDSNSSFRGWLKTVTLNTLSKMARKKNVPAFLPLQQSQHPSAESSAAKDIFQQLPERALEIVKETVDDSTWQSFYRVTMAQEPVNEVAAELGLTPTAIRQAKYRVLCRLRVLLLDR